MDVQKNSNYLSILVFIRIARFQSLRVCFPASLTSSFGVINSCLESSRIHRTFIPGHTNLCQIKRPSSVPQVTLKYDSSKIQIKSHFWGQYRVFLGHLRAKLEVFTWSFYKKFWFSFVNHRSRFWMLFWKNFRIKWESLHQCFFR